MIKLIAAAGFLWPSQLRPRDNSGADSSAGRHVSQVRLGCGPFRTELLVSAWPEPLSAIPANSTAKPTAGAIEFEPDVKSRLHRLHCATDCAIQWVGLLSVASGKPTSVRNTLAPLRRGFFCRPPDTETNGSARRFLRLPPMLNHRVVLCWARRRRQALVAIIPLSPASAGLFVGH